MRTVLATLWAVALFLIPGGLVCYLVYRGVKLIRQETAWRKRVVGQSVEMADIIKKCPMCSRGVDLQHDAWSVEDGWHHINCWRARYES